MENNIFVSVQEGLEEPEWIPKIFEFEEKILERLGFKNEEISILFCNDIFIQSLNKEYRNIDSPTDILSFENGETYVDENQNEWIAAGDMVISLDTLLKNADYFGVSQNEELKRLLIHGTLHLNGYDHGEAHIEKGIEPTDEMLVLQEQILKEFGNIDLLQE